MPSLHIPPCSSSLTTPSNDHLRKPEEIKAIHFLKQVDWKSYRYSAQHFHVGGSLTDTLLNLINSVKETEYFSDKKNWLPLFVEESGRLKFTYNIQPMKSEKLAEAEFLNKFDHNEKCQSGAVGVGLSVLGGLLSEWHSAGTYPLLNNVNNSAADKFFYPQYMEPRLNPFKRMSIYNKSFKTKLEKRLEVASNSEWQDLKEKILPKLAEIVLSCCDAVEIFNQYTCGYKDINDLKTETESGLIFCFARDFTPKLNLFYGELLESIISDPRNLKLTKNIVAFDFAGYESMMRFESFEEISMLERLKQISVNLNLSWTFHLGETAESTTLGINNVYRIIQPKRVGHPLYQVYKAIKKNDYSLLEATVQNQILAEVCPAMNNTYDNLKALKTHDQRIRYQDFFNCLKNVGVKFSINPDSTFFNGYTAVQEIGFLLSNKILTNTDIESTLREAQGYNFTTSKT